jgi:Fe-S-cluster-containing dehydrogenase component
MAKVMLIDESKCIGCRACQIACKQWNDNPAEETANRGSYENPPELSGITWTGSSSLRRRKATRWSGSSSSKVACIAPTLAVRRSALQAQCVTTASLC